MRMRLRFAFRAAAGYKGEPSQWEECLQEPACSPADWPSHWRKVEDSSERGFGAGM